MYAAPIIVFILTYFHACSYMLELYSYKLVGSLRKHLYRHHNILTPGPGSVEGDETVVGDD